MDRAIHREHYSFWRIGIFVLLIVAGLFYVKWSPYYDKALVAAQTHSIGLPILTSSDGTIPAPSLAAALNYAVAYGLAIWKALLLGLLIGSGLNVLLPESWVRRIFGKPDLNSVMMGSLFSVPSMMCTCCAAPVINGLRQSRAAPGSTVAYWLGNTMLNPATLIFMWFVLGWQWVGFRLLWGLVMVIGLGWLINRINDTSQPAYAPVSMPTPAEPKKRVNAGVIARRWSQSFLSMALRLLPEYLILVLLLGAARAWLFPMFDMDVGNTIFWISAAALAGLLFVIPTAGEVPIVQAMLLAGVPVGPAAALLVTLPPVSLPSLVMVGRSFRRMQLSTLIAGVLVIGILAGFSAVLLGL